jgi:hypothetical protein
LSVLLLSVVTVVSVLRLVRVTLFYPALSSLLRRPQNSKTTYKSKTALTMVWCFLVEKICHVKPRESHVRLAHIIYIHKRPFETSCAASAGSAR